MIKNMTWKRFFRYGALGLTILFMLWVIAIAVVYFLVDAEDIKKFAVKTVNENTSGELSLGEIKLKVFPLVHFEIHELAFKSAPSFDRQEMFGCKSAKLSFNLFTLIIGKPRISLRLDKPAINFISDGKTNNISATFKSEKKSKTPDVLSYLFISKFTFNINDAHLRYKTPKDLQEIKGLDMDLSIDPVTTSIDLDIDTPIDYKKLDTIVKGDLRIRADVRFVSKERSDITASVDATKLLISTKAIEKKKGEALKITADAETDLKNSIKVKNISLVLIENLLNMSGSITDLSSGVPFINLVMRPSPKYDVSKLGKVVKALSQQNISGNLAGEMNIKGNIPKEGSGNSLSVSGVIDATNVAAGGASFAKTKGMPLTVKVGLKTDSNSLDMSGVSVEFRDGSNKDILEFAMKGSVKGLSAVKPILDLNVEKLNVYLANLAKHIPALSKYPVSGVLRSKASISGSTSPLPIVNIELRYLDDVNKNNVDVRVSNTEKSRSLVVANISANTIDLNPYLPPKKEKPKKSAKGGKDAKGTASDTTEDETPKKKIDEDMEVVKKEDVEAIKKALDKYSIKLVTRVNKFISRDLVINNFVLDGVFTKDELAISNMNLSLLKGDISGAMRVGLDLKSPTYKGKLDLKGIKVKDAAEIFMPNITGVVDGVVSTNVDFTASGYSMKPIKQSMTGNGSFSFNNFAYSAIELNDLINEKLKDKLGSLGFSGDKKILSSNPGWETVQGKFNIKDGKINVESLFAKEGEYEASGKGEVTFTEYMDMYIDLLVPYRNIPYEALKVEGKDKSKIPVHVLGPILKPRFDGVHLIKYVAERALAQETEKLKQEAQAKIQAEAKRLEEEAKRKAQEAVAPVQQKANEELKKVGEDLKKSLKGLKF